MDNLDISKISGQTLRDLLYNLKEFGYTAECITSPNGQPMSDLYRIYNRKYPIELEVSISSDYFVAYHTDHSFIMRFNVGQFTLVENKEWVIVNEGGSRTVLRA